MLLCGYLLNTCIHETNLRFATLPFHIVDNLIRSFWLVNKIQSCNKLNMSLKLRSQHVYLTQFIPSEFCFYFFLEISDQYFFSRAIFGKR